MHLCAQLTDSVRGEGEFKGLSFDRSRIVVGPTCVILFEIVTVVFGVSPFHTIHMIAMD